MPTSCKSTRVFQLFSPVSDLYPAIGKGHVNYTSNSIPSRGQGKFETLLRDTGARLIIYSPLTGFDTRLTVPPTQIAVDYGQYVTLPAGTPRSTKQAVVLGAGLLPGTWQWSSDNPVHMICHSQGGNTVRLLIELLSGRHGIRNKTYFNLANRQDFVKSVITLGTPYLGTTITDVIFTVSPYFGCTSPHKTEDLMFANVPSC